MKWSHRKNGVPEFSLSQVIARSVMTSAEGNRLRDADARLQSSTGCSIAVQPWARSAAGSREGGVPGNSRQTAAAVVAKGIRSMDHDLTGRK